jgi:hypothetical protein
VHAFDAKETKTYRVKATISYSNENSDARETTDEIPVEIEPTGLRFDCSPAPIAYQPTTFTAQVNEGVPAPRWYEWNFGDGSAIIRTPSPSVVYAFNNRVKVEDGPQTYTVSLKAIYDADCPGARKQRRVAYWWPPRENWHRPAGFPSPLRVGALYGHLGGRSR